jgi:hypothetical protein
MQRLLEKVLIGTDPYSGMFWLATNNDHDADNYPRQQPLATPVRTQLKP